MLTAVGSFGFVTVSGQVNPNKFAAGGGAVLVGFQRAFHFLGQVGSFFLSESMTVFDADFTLDIEIIGIRDVPGQGAVHGVAAGQVVRENAPCCEHTGALCAGWAGGMFADGSDVTAQPNCGGAAL